MSLLAIPKALFLLTLASAHAAPSLPEFSAKELEALERGEVVVRSNVRETPQGKAGHSIGFGLINTSVAQAWDAVDDYAGYVSLTPRLAESEVLERTEQTARVFQRYQVLKQSFAFTLNVRFDPGTHTMRWTLDRDRPSDVSDLRGRITYLPYGNGRTLMVYEIWLDSGVWTPPFVEQLLTRQDLPELIGRVRARTEALAAAQH